MISFDPELTISFTNLDMKVKIFPGMQKQKVQIVIVITFVNVFFVFVLCFMFASQF